MQSCGSGGLMQNSLIMNDNETILSRHSYTETGMLRDKLLNPQGSQALYRLRHDYNVRGWLTGINNPADGHPDRYFGMRLYYDSPPQHAIPHAKGQFNGNISAMQWFTKEAEASTNTNGYAYAYDGLNRLTNAVFYRFKDGSVSYVLPEHASNKQQNFGLVTGIGSVNEIRYDKNGNILGLKRLARQNDEVILFDHLTYFYNDNRLIAVDDVQQGQNTLGDFHDNGLVYSSHNMDEYYYDDNGNMIADLNRNMKLMYGMLHNMPVFISFAEVGGGGGGGLVEAEPIDASGKTAATTSYSGDIVNHYTYQGRKLGKKVYNSQHTLTVDEEYYDELMFNFGKPSRISHADGYLTLSRNGSVAEVYYYLKDHLGNVRSVITHYNDTPVVVQTNDYFPFGMSLSNAISHSDNPNKHKYNGKEEQEMPGKWLDYGARFYDPALGRWHAIDPKADWYYSMSPYNYAANNPIILKDPNGQWIESAWDAFSLGTGVTSLISNIKEGNVLSAVVDGVGIVADAVALAVPIVPGGAGAGIKALRAADNLVDAAQTVKTADKVTDGAKTLSKTEKLQESAKTGQEAHRQIQKELREQGAKTEVPMTLKDGTNVRKDGVRPDGTTVIIKPDTPSGQKSATARENLMQKKWS